MQYKGPQVSVKPYQRETKKFETIKAMASPEEKWKKLEISTKAKFSTDFNPWDQTRNPIVVHNSGDTRLDNLIEKYPTIETKGIHFHLSPKSVYHDFYVKVTRIKKDKEEVHRGWGVTVQGKGLKFNSVQFTRTKFIL